MEVKFNESALPILYSEGLFEEKLMDLAPEHADKYALILFTSVSNALNHYKSKEYPVSFDFELPDGKFIAAAIVQFFPNEDPEKPGNWNLVWTFNESDIPENTKRIKFSDTNTHSYFRSVAGTKYGVTFKNTECLVVPTTYLLQMIHKFLDENAKADEIFTVELDSVFQARVAVEEGAKVFAIEPKGEIKQLIKDDASIEK